MTSDSGFIQSEQFSHEWQNISVLQRRRDNIVYTGERYGRRFLLKTLQPERASLTEYRLQQEKEFRLGIALSHPNIAAIYSLEEVPGIGRCIVQEWIDGQTLSEWLQTKPSHTARQNIFEQLLDALMYLHAHQRVHHDLKSSNILVTHNGQNVKLIDFGLADSDDGTTNAEQDVRDDIRKLAPLMGMLFPHRFRLLARACARGKYPNIAALQKSWQHRKQTRKIIPILLATVLLVIASLLFYLAYEERHAEQRKQQEMIERVNEAFVIHEAEMRAAIASVPTTSKASEMMATITEEGWLIRDSLISLYPEKDPDRIIIFNLWTQRDAILQTELIDQIMAKPRY